MATRSKLLKGPAISSRTNTSSTVQGSQFLIGDGIYLTAGHMVFEYNHAHDSSPNDITIADIVTQNQGSDRYTIISDFRKYREKYASQVKTEYLNAPTNHPNNLTIEGKGALSANDIVLISGSGNATPSNYGMAYFAAPADLTALSSKLPGSTVSFDGYVSGIVSGGMVTSATGGRLIYSKIDQEGDSGGAFLLNYNSTAYILGSISGKDTSKSYGTYFTADDWSAVNVALIVNQTGNVTATEPTNLVIGAATADTSLIGSFRADIILGLGGDDRIDGGDQAGPTLRAWGNDQIFGGAGNDVILAGYGNDLFHGGNRPVGTSATNQAAIDADGVDTVDYSALTNSDPTHGIKIVLANAFDTTYQSNPDFSRAFWVADLGRDKSVDTLLSVEKIIATSADDILAVNSLRYQSLAAYSTNDHFGGLDLVDLGSNSKGDLLDLSTFDDSIFVDLSSSIGTITYLFTEPGTVATSLSVSGVEQVILSQYVDKFQGGPANERILGGGGADYIDGGDGNDIIFGSFGLTPSDGSIDKLSGGNGDDVLVAGNFVEMTGGSGNDTFIFEKNTSGAFSYTIKNPDSGDKLIWNGYQLTGGSAVHLDVFNFGTSPNDNIHWEMGYLDTYGTAYIYGAVSMPGQLFILFPDGSELKVLNWDQGELGINLTGPTFAKEQWAQTEDPFPGLAFSNVCNDGQWANWGDLSGRTASLAGHGAVVTPDFPVI